MLKEQNLQLSDLILINIEEFMSNYMIVKDALTIRKTPVIVMHSYSRYPNGKTMDCFASIN